MSAVSPTPTPNVIAILGQLREFTWRSISVPTIGMEMTLTHDLARHKPADSDGEEIEGTGLQAIEFHARIPLLNTIYPAGNESWTQGVLFPQAFKSFISAFADRSTGTLGFPLLGDVTCKPHTLRAVLSGERRGGVEIEASWLQTVTAADAKSVLAQPSALATGLTSAVQLDDNISAAVPSFPTLPVPPVTLDSIMNGLLAAVDSITILEHRVQGQAANLIGQVNRLENALDLIVPTPGGPAPALLWPLYANGGSAKASVQALKHIILQARRTIGLFTNPADASIGSVFAQISALSPALEFEDMIELNAHLFQSPVVPHGTVVRYYAP